jgi:putative transposase
VLTEIGAVDLDIPRDRDGTFEPKLVPKGTTRLARFNENIVALYAAGMTTRDITKTLKRMYSVEVSADLISRVTDGVVSELAEWQARPLDVYPIVYIDALVVKVRTSGVVSNRPAYVAVGVDTEGRTHVLGVWLGVGGEGAKYWLAVLTELANRGLKDVIFVCCDGLKGLPDAIEATWPQANVQTCTVHLIRASIRYCSWKDRKKVAAALRPIYTAPSVEAAADAMDTFELEHGDRYPGIVAVWRNAWERFIPFLAYPAIIRKIVYTTNMVESVNYQMRKSSKTRGHFPDDDAALKLLRLIARDLSTTRGGAAGTGTQGWAEALNAFEIHFPNRLNIC